MAESDEEYDRRRRDKFRRERSDYQDRRDDRARREDFPERDSWNSRDRGGRRDYRDFEVRGRRDRYSPPPPRHEVSPPMKRMRRDWDERGSGYMGGGASYDMGYHGASGNSGSGMPPHHHGNWGGSGINHEMGPFDRDVEPGTTQPPMLTFKQYLAQQDDAIDDQEAVKKYNEYKVNFRKDQLSEFFINHKEEEWFKSKYHPEECGKRKSEQQMALSRRLSTFMELYNEKMTENISIEVDKSEQIIRLLDAVVIKLEGGTEFDLQALDEVWEDPKTFQSLYPVVKEIKPIEDEITKRNLKEKNVSEAQDTSFEKDIKENDSDQEKIKKATSGDENSSSSNSSSSDSDDENSFGSDKKKRKSKKKSETKLDVETGETEKKDEDKDEKMEEDKKDEKLETEKENSDGEIDKKIAETPEEVKKEEPDIPKPRHLHRTSSIFLRNLAPTITKQEVEALCRKYSGYLRVAIADPQPERHFFRRGWVTFERNVNIKEIAWNLNSIRLRDCELGAIVNRDLSRRIRSVNGITAHKQVVRTDIKLTAQIIQNLDAQKGLWTDEKTKEQQSETEVLNLVSRNPLLKNITDYLIEEASAEEEELLGISSTEDQVKDEGNEGGATLERDEVLIKVLDKLLLYLRIVHSVDYYNHSDYPNEDEMPNRCGIMHARGSPPNSKVSLQEVNDYVGQFEPKISTFLQPNKKLVKEEAVKLGLKDAEAEVEKFVQSNTQEVGKEKWLCPLSGKKFKGPEFIRKHIFNKHGERVDEVVREVHYFNNYILDPKRPQLPEHPSNRTAPPQPTGTVHHPGGRGEGHMPGNTFNPTPHFGYGGHRGIQHFGGGFGGRNNYQDRGGNFGKRNFVRNNPRNDQRKVITYNDLDAPNENDFF